MTEANRNRWSRTLNWLLFFCASAVVAVGAGDASAAPPSEPVGLVTELTGSGSISQKPENGPLEPLRELWPGAVVALADGARATIVHTPTGTVYELIGPGRFVVRPKGIEPLDKARLKKRDLPPELKTFQLKPLSTMQASVVMRGATAVRLEGPNGGVLGADELNYRIRGNLVVQAVEIVETETSAVSPVREAGTAFNAGAALAVRPGRQYIVIVKGTDAQGRATELASRFWLIEAEAAARLRAARPGPSATVTDLIVYAMALETAGATASARAAWNVINERR